MFKAMILTLLGATFEVRVISPTTGKNIPGRSIYQGGYWKARKVYQKQVGKLKYGYVLRLQARTLLAHEINIITPYEPEIADVEAENPLEDIKSLYQGEDLVDPARPRTHECNVQGPLEYDSNAACYVPTCDVCGRLN